ncbi:hypothetical protein [Paenibacillus xylaniclasticus]|uniref:hypothetical protein n=1 Tax=Paenibacillus xylaniclasticus TaxID=588083 RepID=UPI000FDC9555|nr:MULTISPECIES: hypothetical protein [Paenibacillus]GFN30941.1 hypothetical protein PCURB6_12010 [Paenibacillus curdlanolyticus]
MSRFFGFVNMMVILFLAALIVGYMNYVQKEKDELERLKLSYAADYATDAGAMELLNTGSLDMDYTDIGSFNLNPNLALDAFLSVFCLNYDLQPTEENKALIKDFIPVAAVATYDGYYLAQHSIVRNRGGLYPESGINDADWDLTFGMKLPYTYERSGDTSKTYALNMGLEYTLVVQDGSLTKMNGLPLNDEGKTMSRIEARRYINDRISQHMAYVIDETNKASPYWRNRFFIPSQLTDRWGVNPIEGPSFIVLVQGVNLTSVRPISGFSVAGTRIDQARMVVAYRRMEGVSIVKYYAYADQLPAHYESLGIVLDEMFSTQKEAAEAGYSFDAAMNPKYPLQP